MNIKISKNYITMSGEFYRKLFPLFKKCKNFFISFSCLDALSSKDLQEMLVSIYQNEFTLVSYEYGELKRVNSYML